MATVWLAHDELLARRVAVKALHPDLAGDEKLRARFRQEAIAAAGLTHPNIVATYDTGEDDGIAFIVMELVEGESLRQVLDRKGALDIGTAVNIARQVSAALEAAHRNGIVHRDVKPANVLVPRDGPVKVTDFGIAKATGSADFTRTGTVVGTARYLSPEQVQGVPTDPRTDVYALGLVLYEMIAGRPAYQGDSEMATAVARLEGRRSPSRRSDPASPRASSPCSTMRCSPTPRTASRARPRSASCSSVAPALPPHPAPRPRPATAPTRPGPHGGAADSDPGPTDAGAQGEAQAETQARAWVARPRVRPLPRRARRGGWPAHGSADRRQRGRWRRRRWRWIVEWRAPRDRQGHGLRSVRRPGPTSQENPEAVRFTYDGLPATAWQSETYNTRVRQREAGSRLVVELDATDDVSAVENRRECGLRRRDLRLG